MPLDRDRALALMHEYTPSDALRKHMYAVETRHAGHGRTRRRRPRGLGPGRTAARLRLRALPQRRRTRPTEEHPAEGVRILTATGLPEASGAPSWATRATPASRATRRWPGALRRGRAVRIPGGLRPGPALAQPPGSGGLERQEEAQGQGVRARREPGRRDAGRRRAGRAARRTHRLRARGAPTRTSAGSASARHDRGRRRRPALRAEQSVTSAINRAAGGRPIPGNQVTPADRRPGRVRRDDRGHRDARPAGSTSRTTSSGATPPAGASPRRWPRARAKACRSACSTTGSGCVGTPRALLARSARGRRGGPRAFTRLAARPGDQRLAQPSQAGRGRRGARGHRRTLHRLRMDRRSARRDGQPGGTRRSTSPAPPPRCSIRPSPGPGQLAGGALPDEQVARRVNRRAGRRFG